MCYTALNYYLDMKLDELTVNKKPKTNTPHLYLDMDGVQADFFGAWARANGVSNWKAIHDKEKEIEVLAHSSYDRVYEFFDELSPLPGGLQLISWLKTNKIAFTVCSAPLRGPWADASIAAKKNWLDRYNPGTSDSAIFTSDKYRYALFNGDANVLVDDYDPYLNAWRNAGGIAVKYKDRLVQQVIQELEVIYSK
tara:strand:+ start:2952 stop:3536 length:585 start_codon:yes stop_codon:yes gene_type:complete